MTETLHFELVSPEEKLVSEPVKMAVVPGEEGELGVMPHHASFVVSLKPGIVSLYKDNENDIHRIFIAGGFADISGDNCSVLAEEAIAVKDLNAEELSQTISNLQEDLTLAKERADRKRIRSKIEIATIKLAAAQQAT